MSCDSQIEKVSKQRREYLKFKPFADDLRKAESWCELDGVLNRYQTVKNLSKMGYRKASDVAEKIFAEIEKIVDMHYNNHIFGNNDLDDLERDAIINFSDDITCDIAELKKKYTVEEANGDCLSMNILEIIGLIDAMFERQRFESRWVDKNGVVIGCADIGHASEIWNNFIKKELLEER